MPNDPCPLCDGTLQTTAAHSGGYTGEATPAPGPPMPCPRCLSVPATDEIREVAREWLGMDVWHLYAALALNDEHWHPPGDRRAPLYLPAGRDLAVRVLARREGFKSECVAFQPAPLLSGWLLIGRPQWSRFPAPKPEQTGWHSDPAFPSWNRLPALATIPKDAPPDLQAARALALCLGAADAE